MVIQKIKGYKPLCFVNEKLYLYKKGKIYVLTNNHLEKKAEVYKKSFKEITRWSSRLFRCEPKYAIPLNENAILLVGHHKIKSIDLEKKIVTNVVDSRDGFSDPLNICIATERWLAVWGDYGSNKEHKKINLYGLTPTGNVEVIYSFEGGQVRHVHNIIPKLNGGYYILTGDQESDAGIYEADSLFNKVIKVKTGKQQYRAVVGFDTSQGLLYATDAVNEKNYVYLLSQKKEIKVICELNGSCIYGTQIQNNYYFSTTVEPDENNKGLTSWLSAKRGKGILSNEVYLIEVKENMEFKNIIKLKKDKFPMKLMQYGSIQFPRGNSKELWGYPIAVKKNDGVALRFK